MHSYIIKPPLYWHYS